LIDLGPSEPFTQGFCRTTYLAGKGNDRRPLGLMMILLFLKHSNNTSSPIKPADFTNKYDDAVHAISPHIIYYHFLIYCPALFTAPTITDVSTHLSR
jgi:hypothetical protein